MCFIRSNEILLYYIDIKNIMFYCLYLQGSISSTLAQHGRSPSVDSSASASFSDVGSVFSNSSVSLGLASSDAGGSSSDTTTIDVTNNSSTPDVTLANISDDSTQLADDESSVKTSNKNISSTSEGRTRNRSNDNVNSTRLLDNEMNASAKRGQVKTLFLLNNEVRSNGDDPAGCISSSDSTTSSPSAKVFNPFPKQHTNSRRTRNGIRLGLYSTENMTRVEPTSSAFRSFSGDAPARVATERARHDACVHHQYLAEISRTSKH